MRSEGLRQYAACVEIGKPQSPCNQITTSRCEVRGARKRRETRDERRETRRPSRPCWRPARYPDSSAHGLTPPIGWQEQ